MQFASLLATKKQPKNHLNSVPVIGVIASFKPMRAHLNVL